MEEKTRPAPTAVHADSVSYPHTAVGAGLQTRPNVPHVVNTHRPKVESGMNQGKSEKGEYRWQRFSRLRSWS
jgi:hypothetical protein